MSSPRLFVHHRTVAHHLDNRQSTRLQGQLIGCTRLELTAVLDDRRTCPSPTLLRQLRYERAVLYDQVGRKAPARRELERVYAEDSRFEDARERLGLSPQ